jgi:hypothetical protein
MQDSSGVIEQDPLESICNCQGIGNLTLEERAEKDLETRKMESNHYTKYIATYEGFNDLLDTWLIKEFLQHDGFMTCFRKISKMKHMDFDESMDKNLPKYPLCMQILPRMYILIK